LDYNSNFDKNTILTFFCKITEKITKNRAFLLGFLFKIQKILRVTLSRIFSLPTQGKFRDPASAAIATAIGFAPPALK